MPMKQLFNMGKIMTPFFIVSSNFLTLCFREINDDKA